MLPLSQKWFAQHVEALFKLFAYLAITESSTASATANVADLFAYISAVYEAQIGTNLTIVSLFLRTTEADPWSAIATDSALNELSEYWNTNYSAVSRTAVHLLSGNILGGGRAYLGALCDSLAYGSLGD